MLCTKIFVILLDGLMGIWCISFMSWFVYQSIIFMNYLFWQGLVNWLPLSYCWDSMTESHSNASVSSSSSLNSSFPDTEDDHTIAAILAADENSKTDQGKLGKRLSHLDSIPVWILSLSIVLFNIPVLIFFSELWFQWLWDRSKVFIFPIYSCLQITLLEAFVPSRWVCMFLLTLFSC